MATGAKRRIGVPGEARLAGVIVEPPFVFGSRNTRWHDFARHDSLKLSMPSMEKPKLAMRSLKKRSLAWTKKKRLGRF